MRASKIAHLLFVAVVMMTMTAAASFAEEGGVRAAAAAYSIALDHCTFSFLDNDYKAQYTGGATRFGFLGLREVEGSPLPNAGVTLSITPNNSFTIKYAGPQYSSAYDISSLLLSGADMVSERFDQKSQVTVTFDVRYGRAFGSNGIPIFVDDAESAESALSGATYRLTVSNDIGTGSFQVLSTNDQLKHKYVPYVELHLDEDRKNATGISWRPVSADDRSKLVSMPSNPGDHFDGMFGYYKNDSKPGFSIRITMHRKSGFGWSYNGGELTDVISGTQTFYSPIPLDDIASITFDDGRGWNWSFFPPQEDQGIVGDNTTIDPVTVTATPSAGSFIGGFRCYDGNRPSPTDVNIKDIEIVRTLSAAVLYHLNDIQRGATVRIEIPGFRKTPIGKLYALARGSNGGWDRFPMTQGPSGIRFEMPIEGYFLPANITDVDLNNYSSRAIDITIADIWGSGGGWNSGGGSGGGGCAVASLALVGLAALAIVKRRS